jgi:hypothetical protein
VGLSVWLRPIFASFARLRGYWWGYWRGLSTVCRSLKVFIPQIWIVLRRASRDFFGRAVTQAVTARPGSVILPVEFPLVKRSSAVSLVTVSGLFRITA